MTLFAVHRIKNLQCRCIGDVDLWSANSVFVKLYKDIGQLARLKVCLLSFDDDYCGWIVVLLDTITFAV